MKVSFLHLADVHLDSPLSNVKRLDATTAERLQRASRRSLEIAANFAIERELPLVVIAGDLFDAPVKDASAGLWVQGLFRRLVNAGVRVALIRGNHDALSNARRVLEWPEGVAEFGSDQPESLVLEDVGLAAHGQSFGARMETADMAAKYPAPVSGMVNIGLLHTSLSGTSAHDTYAPTSLTTLENHGYDYWALGHIHARSPKSLSDSCFVGYSGNTQGRHIREAGPKGCQLVTYQDQRLVSLEFLPLDTVRWHMLSLDVSELTEPQEVEFLVSEKTDELLEAADGRPLAVRVELKGETQMHGALTRPGTLEYLNETLSERIREIGDYWLETVKVRTTPFLARPAEDLLIPLKYLSGSAEAMRTDEGRRAELRMDLEELLKRTRGELQELALPLLQKDQEDGELQRLIGEAENLLVGRLVGEDCHEA